MGGIRRLLADMSTGVLFSKTAPRTSRHLLLFPLGCIWKAGGAMAVTTRPASTETTNVTKNIIDDRKEIWGWICKKDEDGKVLKNR